MPYKNVGAVKNASTEVVMNLELDNDTANITVYSPIQLDDVTIKFVYDGNKMFEEKANISPTDILQECSYAITLMKQSLHLPYIKTETNY